MQAATTLIAWTPPAQGQAKGGDWKATGGMVRLIAWPDINGTSTAYAHVDGACSPRWRRSTPAELATQMFILYAKMVLQGMNPIGAHLALMGVDEYRDNLPPALAVRLDDRASAEPVVRLADYRSAPPATKAS